MMDSFKMLGRQNGWLGAVLRKGRQGVLFHAYCRGMFYKGRIPFKKPVLKNDAFKLATF